MQMSNLTDIPDHPIIRNLMETGYPYREEPKICTCPICGDECYFHYIRDGEIIGCENCITVHDAEDDSFGEGR